MGGPGKGGFAGLLLVSALLLILLPTAIYLFVLWLLDPYEREPFSDLGVMLVAGAIVAPLLTRLVEVVFGLPNSVYPGLFQVYQIFAGTPPNIWTGVVEEAAKGVVVLAAFIYMRREFDDTLDGFVYGAVVGVGFALTESLLYVKDLLALGQAAQVSGGYFFAIFFSGLSQCFFTGIFGASLGYMREADPGDWAIGLGGFLVAALYHVAYVGLAAVASSPGAGTAGALAGVGRVLVNWLGVAVVIVMLRWAWARERQIFSQTLADEVGTGSVTSDELEFLASGHRVGRQVATLRGEGWARYQSERRLHQALAELAFAKWRIHRGVGSDEEVKRAREEVRRRRGSGGRA